MSRTQTMVQLNEDLVGLLDAEAQRRDTSRSALIRELLGDALAGSREAAADAAIAAGYRRDPQVTPDAWGRLDEEVERSAVETMRRLDAEESERW